MNRKIYYTVLSISGILILSYSIYIHLISTDFTYHAHPSPSSIRLYAITRIIIGIVYTFAIVLLIRKKLFSNKTFILVFIVGLVSRIVLIPSDPILEDDFNRYLWDGAVSANGFNPYEFAPSQFIETDSTRISGLEELYNLADSSGMIIERVNHPHIRTIYPPVAQIFFSIAYFVKPWSSSIWKFVLLALDIFVFFILVRILKKLNYHKVLTAIYWWNPILLHEMFNAGHMDLVMYPFILLGILYLLKDKIVFSASMFAIAVGGKIWPIIFIPFALKKSIKNNNQFRYALISIIIIFLMIFLPIIITKLDNSLGFITYTKNWTNNESIFQIINIIAKWLIGLFDINYHCSLCVARWVVFVAFGILILFLLRQNYNKSEILKYFYYLVAIMFLISPTQFPWYYTWVLPLLVFNPRISFIAYTIFLPLYQLKYSMPGLVWVEHLPIIGLFILEFVHPKFKKFLTV